MGSYFKMSLVKPEKIENKTPYPKAEGVKEQKYIRVK